MTTDTARLVRRQDLLRAGFTDDEVRHRLRTGAVLPLRPGAYLLPTTARPRDPEERHALVVRAALPDLAPQAVVSHGSAAVLHGLPAWGIPLDRVSATRARRGGARRTAGVHLHAAALDADEIEVVDGVAVTSVARTVVDVAREQPFVVAVALADAALHAERTIPAALEAALVRAAGRPGCPRARRAIAFADGLSESVGESRSRVAMHLAGLPVPVLQQPFVTRSGQDLGRVDFWWPRWRTVGEFDGRNKYGRLLRPGQDPGEVVFAEKQREDLIREEDTRFVRWTWSQIDPFDGVASRLRRAFGHR